MELLKNLIDGVSSRIRKYLELQGGYTGKYILNSACLIFVYDMYVSEIHIRKCFSGHIVFN